MNLYLKIVLILFGLAYLISPVDIIPDLLLPYIGWIDDGVILGTIVYLIRYGKLPDFLFKKKGPFHQTFNQKTENSASNNEKKESSGPADQKNSSFESSFENPYKILGIASTASKKEIQSAYKTAIKKYHPDKLSHLGEEFSDLASKKFLEIQQAYDTLMKK